MGRNRYNFIENNNPHFVTCTVLHWIPVFTRPETVSILLDSLRYLMSNGLKVYGYVILENHMHLIVQSDHLSIDIRRFKSFTAKEIIRLLKEAKVTMILDQLAFYKKAHKTNRGYQFWDEGVHPIWIQNEAMLRQKIEYIHNNPVVRGYVDKPEHWRYSSARNYLGMEALLDVCTDW
jgi:putative transposase